MNLQAARQTKACMLIEFLPLVTTALLHPILCMEHPSFFVKQEVTEHIALLTNVTCQVPSKGQGEAECL